MWLSVKSTEIKPLSPYLDIICKHTLKNILVKGSRLWVLILITGISFTYKLKYSSTVCQKVSPTQSKTTVVVKCSHGRRDLQVDEYHSSSQKSNPKKVASVRVSIHDQRTVPKLNVMGSPITTTCIKYVNKRNVYRWHYFKFRERVKISIKQ